MTDPRGGSRLPRPDLRPMLILLVLLVAVGIAWALVATFLLPPRT